MSKKYIIILRSAQTSSIMGMPTKSSIDEIQNKPRYRTTSKSNTAQINQQTQTNWLFTTNDLIENKISNKVTSHQKMMQNTFRLKVFMDILPTLYEMYDCHQTRHLSIGLMSKIQKTYWNNHTYLQLSQQWNNLKKVLRLIIIKIFSEYIPKFQTIKIMDEYIGQICLNLILIEFIPILRTKILYWHTSFF